MMTLLNAGPKQTCQSEESTPGLGSRALLPLRMLNRYRRPHSLRVLLFNFSTGRICKDNLERRDIPTSQVWPKSDSHIALVTSLFPDRILIGKHKPATPSAQCRSEEGPIKVLSNSVGRVLVYCVACCICHVGSGALPYRQHPCPGSLTLCG